MLYPCLASTHLLGVLERDTESRAYVLVDGPRRTHGPDTFNVISRKSGHPVRLANILGRKPPGITAPLHNVPGIVLGRSWPKVGRVAAGRIIAGVENIRAIRDRPVGKLPCPPMGQDGAALRRIP